MAERKIKMNAFCILFTDTYDNKDSKIAELSNARTLASIPFGGRYRLIDFILSSLVGAGVGNIGIITKSKYGSLMDHLNWGKDWDLNRKHGGLKILAPFAGNSVSRSESQFDILRSINAYIDDAPEEYCIISDSNMVINIDFNKVFDAHKKSGADMTIIYRDSASKEGDIELGIGEDKRIYDVLYHTTENSDKKNIALNIFILKKTLLRELIDRGVTYGWKDFGRDVITKKFKELSFYGYKHEGYCKLIDSLEVYLRANLEMLNSETRNEIFKSEQPILTRIKDSVPTQYGESANVKNSYIADGCVINGDVENSIIFRSVKIEKGAKVKNSVVMQNTVVEGNSSLTSVISDKNARITGSKTISGCDTLPIVINKGKVV